LMVTYVLLILIHMSITLAYISPPLAYISVMTFLVEGRTYHIH
jgi:hypothetical protein